MIDVPRKIFYSWVDFRKEQFGKNPDSALEKLIKDYKGASFKDNDKIVTKFTDLFWDFFTDDRFDKLTKEEEIFYFHTLDEVLEFFIVDYKKFFSYKNVGIIDIFIPKKEKIYKLISYLNRQDFFIYNSILRIIETKMTEEYSHLTKEQRIHFLCNFSPFVSNDNYSKVLSLFKETVIENPITHLYPSISDSHYIKNTVNHGDTQEWLDVKVYLVPNTLSSNLFFTSFRSAARDVMLMFMKKYSEVKVIVTLTKFLSENHDFNFDLFEALLKDENSHLLNIPLNIAESLFSNKNVSV